MLARFLCGCIATSSCPDEAHRRLLTSMINHLPMQERLVKLGDISGGSATGGSNVADGGGSHAGRRRAHALAEGAGAVAAPGGCELPPAEEADVEMLAGAPATTAVLSALTPRGSSRQDDSDAADTGMSPGTHPSLEMRQLDVAVFSPPHTSRRSHMTIPRPSTRAPSVQFSNNC